MAAEAVWPKDSRARNRVRRKAGMLIVPDPEEPDGLERAQSKTIETMAIEQNEEEQEFGNGLLGFPTDRRPANYVRPYNSDLTESDRKWLDHYPNLFGDQIDTGEKRTIAERLLTTWRDLFVTDIENMPATDLLEHRIPTYSHAVPKVARIGLFTPEEVQFQRTLLPKMEKAGIITKCESPWSARTKFPRRKNGKLRMVHAFIPINNATIKSQYPMKRLEPILQDISRRGMTTFFTADAANGYWAVPLHRKHAYKTAFSAYDGQYCYLRMGQGLTGGPATYSRLKDLATGRIPEPQSEPALSNTADNVMFSHFVDDDWGGADRFETLVDFLHQRYFPRLAWSGLTANPEKSTFFASRINGLGHTRTPDGIRPSADKLAAFRDWPPPTNEEELMRFIYTLPFFRAFIPGRADLTMIMKSALTQELVQRTVKGKQRNFRHTIGFEWTNTQNEAFEATKAAVLEQSTTAGDPDRQYHLATDASNTGAGGVLFQIDDVPPGTPSSAATRKNERVVMFMSFQLLPAETRYKTTEREALAVLKCLEECRWMILGSKYPVKLYTDHSALVSLLNGDDSHGRIARWQYRLSEYTLDIRHIPGRDIVIADGLSRIRQEKAETRTQQMATGKHREAIIMVCEEVTATAMVEPDQDPYHPSAIEAAVDPDWEEGWEDWIACPWYSDIVEFKLTGRTVVHGMLAQAEQRKLQRQALRFVICEGEARKLLYRERSGKMSSCLLPHEIEEALRFLHDIHGHFAEDIVMQKAIGRFYWPSRRRDIYKYCRSCINCQMLGPLRPTRGLLPILQLQPLDMMGIDFIGPFRPVADSGARYICIVVDYFTRYLWAAPLPTATSANALEFLQMSITDTFGWPRAVYSDNGSHFTGGVFPRKLADMKVKHILAPVTHPSSVGLAERYVQIVLTGLRAELQTDSQRIFRWDQHVKTVVQGANTRVIRMHGYTPCELLMGMNARYHATEESLEEEIRGEIVATIPELLDGDTIEEVAYTARLAMLDEIRDLANEKRLKAQHGLAVHTQKNRPELCTGDLVLLRRTSQDNQRGHKLEPRWIGPYRLAKKAKHGQSGWLEDLQGKQDLGRYHLNDLKLFLPRTDFASNSANWMDIAQANERLRQSLLRPRRHQQKAELALEERQRLEEDDDIPSEGWFYGPGDNLQSYGDEAGWRFWASREIDLQQLLGLPPTYRLPTNPELRPLRTP